MADSLPAPMVPDCVDLRGFPYVPVFRARLFASEFHARCSDAEWRAGVTLWLKSWDQVPAGTLPDDDVALCRLAELGRDIKSWRKIRAGALRGWVRCADGLLHHPVVAEGVANAWADKVRAMYRSELARVRKARQRGASLPMPVWDSFAAEHGVSVRPGDEDGDVTHLSHGTDAACPTGQKRDVPCVSRGKRTPTDTDTDTYTGKSIRTHKSSAGGPRADVREAGPPAADFDALNAVRGSVIAAFERWFDLPDRPLTHGDDELFADWLAVAGGRGLPADAAVDAIGGEVQRQFQRLADRCAGPPRSLRALLDGDVRTAIGNTALARPDKPRPAPAAEVPEPYAGHFGAVEFERWVRPCGVAVEGKRAVLTAPTRAHADWVSQRLEPRLCAALGVAEIGVVVGADCRAGAL